MNVLNGNDRGTIKVAILVAFFVERYMYQWSRVGLAAFTDWICLNDLFIELL